jgi:hypothetical protein
VHLHLPHLSVPALLLSLLYAAAIAVALTAPGANPLAGAVVLAGLGGRWALRHRARTRVAVPAVLAPEPAPGSAPATAV